MPGARSLPGKRERIRIEYLLDTWVWIEYFRGNPKFKNLFRGEDHYITSVITLTEVVRYCVRNRKEDQIPAIIGDIRAKSYVYPLLNAIAESAGRYYKREIEGIADSIILATARAEGCRIITGDPHFKDLPDCTFIPT